MCGLSSSITFNKTEYLQFMLYQHSPNLLGQIWFWVAHKMVCAFFKYFFFPPNTIPLAFNLYLKNQAAIDIWNFSKH